MRANYKDCEIEFKGKPLFLKRGSFLMSYRSAAEKTGLTTRNIRTAVTALVNFGMIEKSTRQTTQQATVLTICNYNLYQSENSDTDTANDTAATQQRHSSDTAATTDKKDKELIKKSKKSFPENSNEFRLAIFLLNHIRKHKPDFKQPNLQSWAKSADAILRIDKRNLEKVKQVIVWCQQDAFWQGNILSMNTLRNQFDALEVKTRNEKPKSVSLKAEPAEKRMTREELEAFLLEGIAATNNQEEFEAWLKPRCMRCWRIAYNHQQFFHETHGESQFRLFWMRYTEDDE